MAWQRPSMPASWGRYNAVPRYFMNLRCRDRLFIDEEGDELPRDAVREHALETARDLISHARTDSIRNWLDCSFEVADETGRVVLILPFSETIEAD